MSRPAPQDRQDAVDLIIADHRVVDRLFDRYEAMDGTEPPEVKRELVREFTRELSIHASIEEQLFYPTVRDELPQGDDLVEESLDEHQGVKELLAAIEDTDPQDPKFDERVTMLIREVRHHVQEEETEILPGLRARLSEDVLRDLGRRLADAKASAPTHPHPNAPDEGGVVKTIGDRAMGMVDRVRDDMNQDG